MTEREQRIKALDEVVKKLDEFDNKEKRAKEEAERRFVAYDPDISGYTSMSASYMYTTSSGQNMPSHNHNIYPYQAATTAAVPITLDEDAMRNAVKMLEEQGREQRANIANTAGVFSSLITKIKLWK